MKKKIGISYTEVNAPNYWNWFTSADLGIDLELLELSFEKNNVEDIASCDGFVLTGGIDVEPSIFGGAQEYPHRPESFLPERDAFEKLIYEQAKREKAPLLGICRGMQYINILEGGKVYDDIGENANAVHKKAAEDKVHQVSVVEDSLLCTVTGQLQGSVNSAHHQAVHPDHLGASLMVSAYSEAGDGIIEGLEYKDKSDAGFMIGVQWHPERMKEKENNPFSQKIKEQFIIEVRNHKR
jgi:putative glutamine amidotransferase